MANDALHTNDFQVRSHVANSPYCTCYEEDMHESILHALRDCQVLGNFWHRLVNRSAWLEFFYSEPKMMVVAKFAIYMCGKWP